MNIKRGNSVLLMNDAQFNSLIPEHFKTRYWIESTDSEGLKTYTQRTWKELTQDAKYHLGHGKITPFVTSGQLVINGDAPIHIENVHVVSIMASAMRGDVGNIISQGFQYFLNFDEGRDFLKTASDVS